MIDYGSRHDIETNIRPHGWHDEGPRVSGASKKVLEDRAKPDITAPTDAIVKITKTTICGTDLHILKGDVPDLQAGRILGHEGVGIVESVGPAVTHQAGDHVLISCVSACGKCEYLPEARCSPLHDRRLDPRNTIDGTQAEFVRIPYADTSLYPIPAGADEEALVMLSDILPTGFDAACSTARLRRGIPVAIVGAADRLAALLTAQFYSPAEIIHDRSRRQRLES